MPWDIFGHDWAAELLRHQVAAGEVRHAYLFTGPPGVGRRTLAVRLAQAVNCTNPPEPGLPCGQCRACAAIEREQHPDLAVVRRLEDKTVIIIDQVRDLQRSLALAPYEARFRVALLLDFENASTGAQNALLKTLEEAPPRAILLLTASSGESLLPTIVSRCEVLRLRPAPVSALAAELHSRRGLPPNQAEQLAHLAGGRTGYAHRLQNDPDLLQQNELWLVELGELLAMPLRDRLNWSESRLKNIPRDKVRARLEVWLAYFRDLMLVAGGSAAPLTNAAHAEDLRRMANRLDLPAARSLVTGLEDALTRLDANVTPRFTVAAALLTWPRF